MLSLMIGDEEDRIRQSLEILFWLDMIYAFDQRRDIPLDTVTTHLTSSHTCPTHVVTFAF